MDWEIVAEDWQDLYTNKIIVFKLKNYLEFIDGKKFHKESKQCIFDACSMTLEEFKIPQHPTIDKIFQQQQWINWSHEISLDEKISTRSNWTRFPKVYQYYPDVRKKDLICKPVQIGFDSGESRRPEKVQHYFNQKHYRSFYYAVAPKMYHFSKDLKFWKTRYISVLHPDQFDPNLHSLSLINHITRKTEILLQKRFNPIFDGKYGDVKLQKKIKDIDKIGNCAILQ